MTDRAVYPNETSAASVLRRWLRPPEIIADPQQVDSDGRVWAQASDVLPSATIRPGEPAVVAWEDVTWMAIPAWDAVDLDTLWLDPVDEPITGADALALYSPDRSAASPASARHDRPDTTSAEAMREELHALIDLLRETARSDRHLAQDVLAELARLPGKHRRALLRTTAIGRLLQLARRPGLPS